MILPVLCFGLIAAICLIAFRPTTPTNSTIPTTSLEKIICEKIAAEDGDCKKILLYDPRSHLVFAENSSGIIPVLTDNSFTKFKKFIYPMMDYQEFKEEKTDRGPIDWRAENNVQKNFSIIYGFAEDEAKTIVINSEDNIQPTKFFVRDNLWVWYVTFEKDKVKLPVEVTVYNADGQIIYGEFE